MEYDFKLVHIAGKKNRCTNTLSWCLYYDQGNNDNKNLTVLPAKYFQEKLLSPSVKFARETYTRIMISKTMKDKKEERTPLSDNKTKSQKANKSSAATGRVESEGGEDPLIKEN